MGVDRPIDVADPAAVHYDDEERPARELTGRVALAVAVVAAGAGVLTLWQVFRPLAQGSQFYLIVFLAVTLPLIFVAYRARAASPGRPSRLDWVLGGLALAACLYPLNPFGGGYDAFLDRQALLEPADVAFGAVLLITVLEAARRTTGFALPAVCAGFLAYGYYGGLLPQSWPIAHSGLDFAQIVDALYNSGSGFYGTPLDVAATYIVLFTLYGAVLDLSGASRFFVDLSVAAFRRSRSAAGRTAVAAGFLLGTVSGSGTATAVSVGAVTWPMLRRAGYPPEQAGGMLAAAGVGAILSPPTLGAAAFIVAEYLDVSYLTVLGWATIPTLLYYLGILLAVEIDVRRFGVRAVDLPQVGAGRLLIRFGYHFSSLIVIVVLLALGTSATRAVVYATLLAVALSFLDRPGRLTPRRLFQALAAGVRGVLPVVAVCAAAGVITAITTKTGLGAQLASLLVDGARSITGNPAAVLALTVVLAAVALAVLGLAVPVTASFIIGWVIIGPALLGLGVGAPAAAMFVFYYSVLSEVTPPTALAAVGAAAITGGRAMGTMWQALKYALPAFLAPIAFVLTGNGEHLLARGSWPGIVATAVASGFAVFGLAIATGGWVPGVGPAGPASRLLGGVAGLLLLYLSWLAVSAGLGVLAASVLLAAIARWRSRAEPAVPPDTEPRHSRRIGGNR
ncbi:C4-dicarboxylate ABC transporter permease [Actinoplanes sp. SE50]|uniref:TRAP transporter permease n=1 Tax=unclassified Actinoplanes TaxID=2626549 RepID=UPI00023EBF7F|nr:MULTISPECIES: TRAP transporter fused permease subunit [unclassified Actinoplanes]AEV86306.1 Sialic acid TRAP transporter permease protein siaT [Actinoplanes sp. SE50/110]ATO84703.1 C4-dicarboxylate ABC transporter permease [Actinoplanes sp. SE50]SLM02113.1 C4-dicarboxylate ABC transporter permease [Actinoplanes sp. SE50/110]